MNDMPYPIVLRGAALAVMAALAVLATPAASAEQTEPVTELAPIEIHRKTNPGDLPYIPFIATQAYLQSLIPPGAAMIELQQRVNFQGMSTAEQDRFQPESWAVAIVGEHVDQTVPVSRGGYFLLPDLPQAAAENATIMFNTATREGRIGLEWKLRVSEEQTLSYADFAKAFDQLKAVQRKITWDRPGLREVRLVEYDGLTACFLSNTGRIDVGGRTAATVAEGTCRVLKFDTATASAGAAEIAFVGPLDILTLHEAGL